MDRRRLIGWDAGVFMGQGVYQVSSAGAESLVGAADRPRWVPGNSRPIGRSYRG